MGEHCTHLGSSRWGLYISHIVCLVLCHADLRVICNLRLIIINQVVIINGKLYY